MGGRHTPAEGAGQGSMGRLQRWDASLQAGDVPAPGGSPGDLQGQAQGTRKAWPGSCQEAGGKRQGVEQPAQAQDKVREASCGMQWDGWQS